MNPATHRTVVSPRVDVFENDQEVLLVADLPGVPEAAVHLQVAQGGLMLAADTALAETHGRALARENADLQYRAQFSLPRGADVEHIQAELKDGVLRVHVPRHQPSQSRRIPVQTH